MYKPKLQIKHLGFNHICQVWSHLSVRRKRQCLILGVLMIIASIAEVISIGSLFPFLGILMSPEKIFVNSFASPLVTFFRLHGPDELLLFLTLFFIVAVILSGLARLLLFWFQTKLSREIGADFSARVYELTLYQPYSWHTSQNSSEIIAGIDKAGALVGSIIQPVFTIFGSTLIMVAILSAMLAVEPYLTIATLVSLGVIYFFLAYVTKHKIKKNSQTIALQQGKITKAVQEGLGGIRDVLIDGTQDFYSKLYSEALLPSNTASASNQFVAVTPRFAIEAIGLAVIAGAAYFLTSMGGSSKGVSHAIPIIGTLAMGAQRLLPVLQQIYSSYIRFKGSEFSNKDALAFMARPMLITGGKSKIQALPFQKAIVLRDIGYRYSQNSPWVLKALSLEIAKGSRVGFIGATGSGKSTLLDMVMGLLTPVEGVMLIDGEALTQQNTCNWQANISHVPQSIFLSDASIAENIAFGVARDKIDIKYVEYVAQKAQIATTIEGWPNSYDTQVGERGIRLSGGQRQRIGIARALYKRSNVIIFDEATSALDNTTEELVMDAIDTLGRDVTILTIAHRLTTIKRCDFVVEIENGSIKQVQVLNNLIIKNKSIEA